MTILRILLIIIFLIAAAAVTVIVLLQEGKSAGLGSMTGSAGGGNSYWEKNKKHSLEGKFEQWTKITAIVFVLTAFLIMLIPNKSSVNTTPTTSTTEEAQEGGTINSISLGDQSGEAATDETATDETTADEKATEDSANGEEAADEGATSDDANSENASN